ncbi:hypothetical protein [Brenneria tiliae]|uniref:Aldose 1-epimerase n=1 Tax=Brenneria tiliae TaxID=2914984 RepID=A0ABT0MUA9_9GAMM|nr:hypothetical protein [Brenneria tiliae]MCL2893414.1 hypothetical protein [Brenneria tiliae]
MSEPSSSPTLASLVSPDGMLAADLTLQGGFCQQLRFMPETGQTLSVFHRAPWLDDADTQTPPLMAQLGGEWVCVPFGHGQDDGLFFSDCPHGLPANRRWTWIERQAHSAGLAFIFPEDYPLHSLERRIILDNNGEALFSLRILARERCALPVGLHPVFPFGGDAGPLRLKVPEGVRGMTYPCAPEGGVSRFVPLSEIDSLTAVPLTNGDALDVTQLPLPFATEEIVQLLAPVAQIGLYWPRRRLHVTLDWDNKILPDCLLWISNGGRQYAPWNGQNFCLGVEPIHSAWDLGPGALRDNPLRQRGFSTALKLSADEPITLHYRLRCASR